MLALINAGPWRTRSPSLLEFNDTGDFPRLTGAPPEAEIAVSSAPAGSVVICRLAQAVRKTNPAKRAIPNMTSRKMDFFTGNFLHAISPTFRLYDEMKTNQNESIFQW
jgi:hypothetical protein